MYDTHMHSSRVACIMYTSTSTYAHILCTIRVCTAVGYIVRVRTHSVYGTYVHSSRVAGIIYFYCRTITTAT